MELNVKAEKLLPISCCFLLTGCAVFTPPSDNPVIEKKIGWGAKEVRTIATTADRRLFLVSADGKKIIAEPSADAIQNVAARLEAALKAHSKGNLAAGEADVLREVIRKAAHLTLRSQGSVFLRDATYRLAEARLNEFISDADFVSMLRDVLQKSEELIRFELEKNPMLSSLPADGDVALPPKTNNPDAAKE